MLIEANPNDLRYAQLVAANALKKLLHQSWIHLQQTQRVELRNYVRTPPPCPDEGRYCTPMIWRSCTTGAKLPSESRLPVRALRNCIVGAADRVRLQAWVGGDG